MSTYVNIKKNGIDIFSESISSIAASAMSHYLPYDEKITYDVETFGYVIPIRRALEDIKEDRKEEEADYARKAKVSNDMRLGADEAEGLFGIMNEILDHIEQLKYAEAKLEFLNEVLTNEVYDDDYNSIPIKAEFSVG